MQTTLTNEQFDQVLSGPVDLDLGEPGDAPGMIQNLAPSDGTRAGDDVAGLPLDLSTGEAVAQRRAGRFRLVGPGRPRGRPRRRQRAAERRARQGRRPAADRHSAVQHLPERGRRAVAPPHDRGRRVGDGAAPPGRRSADRARALARRQLGDGRLHRSVAPGALARACAGAHPGHRPRHRRGSAPVRRRRRGDPPPAAPVRRRLPAGAVARTARAPGRARAELGEAPRGRHRGVRARRRSGQRIADRACDGRRAAAHARRHRRRARRQRLVRRRRSGRPGTDRRAA